VGKGKTATELVVDVEKEQVNERRGSGMKGFKACASTPETTKMKNSQAKKVKDQTQL